MGTKCLSKDRTAALIIEDLKVKCSN